jgi:hypothetical protein
MIASSRAMEVILISKRQPHYQNDRNPILFTAFSELELLTVAKKYW